MLEFRFPPPHRIDDEHLAAVRRVIDEALDTQRVHGNRAGNQVIFDKIGLSIWDVLDEGYCGEAMDYHLGLLYAHVGDPEKAAFHFERSGTFPATGGYRIFSDHQRDAHDLRRYQEQAMGRGVPSMVIASMPRSASASLTQTLASTVHAPIMRVSCGRYPYFYIVPRWLNAFSRGGAILHDHFGAEPFNLKTLREGGVLDVFVRIRDPRAAAASAIYRHDRNLGIPGDTDAESRVLSLCVESFIPWLTKWIAAATAVESGLRIHFLTQPSKLICEAAWEILSTLSSEYPILDEHLKSSLPEVTANFVTGDAEAWRKGIGSSGQEQLWEAIPQSAKVLLALQR